MSYNRSRSWFAHGDRHLLEAIWVCGRDRLLRETRTVLCFRIVVCLGIAVWAQDHVGSGLRVIVACGMGSLRYTGIGYLSLPALSRLVGRRDRTSRSRASSHSRRSVPGRCQTCAVGNTAFVLTCTVLAASPVASGWRSASGWSLPIFAVDVRLRLRDCLNRCGTRCQEMVWK